MTADVFAPPELFVPLLTMSDKKHATTNAKAADPTLKAATAVPLPQTPGADATLKPDSAAQALGEKSSSRPASRSSILDHALSVENRQTAMRFFSGYAQTWLGMSPLWLLGEAIVPGAEVGSTFKKGAAKLRAAAEEVRQAVSVSAKDIVVILDSKLQEVKGGHMTEVERVAEVVKAAGHVSIFLKSRENSDSV